jgi:hypothetical protein
MVRAFRAATAAMLLVAVGLIAGASGCGDAFSGLIAYEPAATDTGDPTDTGDTTGTGTETDTTGGSETADTTDTTDTGEPTDTDTDTTGGTDTAAEFTLDLDPDFGRQGNRLDIVAQPVTGSTVSFDDETALSAFPDFGPGVLVRGFGVTGGKLTLSIFIDGGAPTTARRVVLRVTTAAGEAVGTGTFYVLPRRSGSNTILPSNRAPSSVQSDVPLEDSGGQL